jgi:hypothetical protein
MTQEDFWKVVEELNYKTDDDFERCSDYLHKNYSLEEILEFENIAWELIRNIDMRFPNIDEISDDSWSDLCYDIVSRGKEFYESITKDIIKEMIKNNDYCESFAYSFH